MYYDMMSPVPMYLIYGIIKKERKKDSTPVVHKYADVCIFCTLQLRHPFHLGSTCMMQTAELEMRVVCPSVF
jgi:hypothetical protein